MENVVKTQKWRIKIIKGSLLGYLNLFLSIVSGILFTPIIISSFSKSSYGLYSLSNSLISLFVFDFGLSATITSFLAKLRANDKKDEINRFITVVYKLYIVVDFLLLVIFTLCFVFIDKIYIGLTLSERHDLRLLFVLSASFSLISFPCSSFNGILQGFEEFSLLKISEFINKIAYIVFTSVCIIFHLSIFYLVVANCLSGLITIIVRYFAIKKKCCIKVKLFSKTDFKFAKTILKYSFWAALNALSARLIFNVMPSILGVVSDSTNITLFSVAAAIESYVYTFGSIMSGFFLPKLARLRNEDNSREKIDRLACVVGKIQFFLIGLIFVGFVCCGRDFVLLWMNYDSTFTISYYGCIVMISTHLVFIPQIIFYTELFFEQHIMKLAIVSLIKAVINLMFGFLLGYYFGCLGAFFSIFIARVFEVVAHNVLYKRCLKANLIKFFRDSIFSYAIPFLTSILIGLTLSLTMDESIYIRLIKCGLYVVCVYVGFSFVSSLKREEKNILLNVIRRK